MQIDIREVPALPVLRRHFRLVLPEVGTKAAAACPGLEAEATARGLVIAGPFVFAATALPMDATTPFDLDVCLPVAESEGCAHLPPFRCAATDYRGPLAGLFERGYGPLLRAIEAAGHRPSGTSREVYHHWAGPEEAGNRVEIQIGIH